MKYFHLLLICFGLINTHNSIPNYEEFEINDNWGFKELHSTYDYLPAKVPGFKIP
jgi:hypothetical protein